MSLILASAKSSAQNTSLHEVVSIESLRKSVKKKIELETKPKQTTQPSQNTSAYPAHPNWI